LSEFGAREFDSVACIVEHVLGRAGGLLVHHGSLHAFVLHFVSLLSRDSEAADWLLVDLVDVLVDRVDVLRLVDWTWGRLVFLRYLERPLLAVCYREPSFSIKLCNWLVLDGTTQKDSD
jgi:hypothetical protein